VSVRGRFIAVVAAIVGLGLPGAAGAAGWSKPAVVAKGSADDLILPYYLQSPNGRKNDLVVGVAYGRDTVYPITSRGRFLRPWRLPDRAGYDAGYDLSDAGATALVWLAESSNQPPEDVRGPEYDWVRAAIRRPNGTFTHRRTITPGREVTGLGTVISPGGAATAFASVWNPEATVEPLRVAEARPYRRFGKPRVIVPSVADWALDTRRGRPILLYDRRAEFNILYELAAPWTHPATIGSKASGSFLFALETLASDGNGNELLVDDGIAVSHRRAGGKFGPFRAIARTRPNDDCNAAATMNRRLALVAWSCSNESTGRVQIAILGPGARVRWRSKLFPAWWAPDAPSVALDRAGRWVVAWQAASRNDRFRALTGRGLRAGRARSLPGPSSQADSPDVALLPGGMAHATWTNETRKAGNVMESRLRIP
jgi:hypothetical protein